MLNKIILSFAFLICIACNKGSNPPAQTEARISINNVSLPEGNNGSIAFEFTVTLDHASAKPVSVNWSTTEGSAKAGQDFTAVSNQTITFGANETSKKIVITVVADDAKEGDENFSVVLSSPVNGSIIKTTGVGTINNDDTKVAFTNAGYDPPASYAGYSLVWNEEFNGPVLDANAWSYEIGDGCPSLCGWGNNELQYYTNSQDNLFFQDGKMIIEAKAQSYGGKNYTSARIKTQGKKTFQYGRIDIRAKLPIGKGLWPAFWLMPQDNVYGVWPKSGEIDVMEYIGSEPSKVLGTAHYGPGPGSIFISKNYLLSSKTFNDEFHVFSIEWKQDIIKWFVDGNLFSTVNKTDVGTNIYPFNEKFYIIVNLAVGGNLPGNPDASTSFPEWYIVDYIRVYQ